MNPTSATHPGKHLIIAGTTRAGTTSLFNYLADHPRIHASTIKETRFFMDCDELRRLHRFEDGPEHYAQFFPECPAEAVRLEATPDYLYRPTAAQRIAETLPDAHVVLILREPVTRLISWHRYAIQNGLLDPGVSLRDYVQGQFDAADQADGEAKPQHQRALKEGLYSEYLPAWLDAFDPGRVTVLPYSELKDDPAGVVKKLCVGLGIDAGYYAGYDFIVHNASRAVRWPRLQAGYRGLIWRVKPYIHDKPATRSALRRLRKVTDTVLGRRGGPGRDAARAQVAETLTESDRQRLEAYYQDEPAALARLLGGDDWHW